jgi:hypothetical protein
MNPLSFLLGLGGTILGKLAGYTLFGALPVGQIAVTLLQFTANVLTEFIKLIFDMARTFQGRCILGAVASALFGVWLWHHVDNLGYQRGYSAGVTYAKQHCPTAQRRRRSR